MDLILRCKQCHKRNRVDWSRLGADFRCGNCHEAIPVQTMVAEHAAALERIAEELRDVKRFDRSGSEETIASELQGLGLDVTCPADVDDDEDPDEDEDDDEDEDED